MKPVTGIKYQGTKPVGLSPVAIDQSRFAGRDHWTLLDWQNNDPDALEALQFVDMAKYNTLLSNPGSTFQASLQKPTPTTASTQPQQVATFPNWDFDTYQTKDPQSLIKMATEAPLQFVAIYKAKFGVVPDGYEDVLINLVRQAGATPVPEALKSWNWDDWQANSPAGGLEALSRENPGHFAAIYKNKFGVLPDGYSI